MALFFNSNGKAFMHDQPTPEEIERVFNWLQFREIKGMVAELLSKYSPTEVNVVNTINAWGEELPGGIVKQEMLLFLSNLLPVYSFCQPEINN
jgi:hypothetical protein